MSFCHYPPRFPPYFFYIQLKVFFARIKVCAASVLHGQAGVPDARRIIFDYGKNEVRIDPNQGGGVPCHARTLNTER